MRFLVIFLALVLIGCTQAGKDITNVEGQDPVNNVEESEVRAETEYIDLSEHDGEIAEMLKVINDSVKAINDGDEETYFSLFDQESDMLDGRKMPLVYFEKVVLLGIGEGAEYGDEYTLVDVDRKEKKDDAKGITRYLMKKGSDRWEIYDSW